MVLQRPWLLPREKLTDVGQENAAFPSAFRQIRSAVTPLRGYTTSAPSGHLLLQEKAFRPVRNYPTNWNWLFAVLNR